MVQQAPACLTEVQLVATRHAAAGYQPGYQAGYQLAHAGWAAHLERMAWPPAQLSVVGDGDGQRAAAAPPARAVSLDASCWLAGDRGGGPLSLDALSQVCAVHQ
jgi:hypothetical protein